MKVRAAALARAGDVDGMGAEDLRIPQLLFRWSCYGENSRDPAAAARLRPEAEKILDLCAKNGCPCSRRG